MAVRASIVDPFDTYDTDVIDATLTRYVNAGSTDLAQRYYVAMIAKGAQPSVIPPGRGTAATPTAPAPTPTAPSGPASVGGLTPDQLNTQAIINATLRQYGLDTPDLIAWARQSVVNGSTADQINLELYDPTSTPGKVVDQLYPAIAQRRAAGLPPVSISDYQATRDTYQQILNRGGLTSYVDAKKLTDDWITGDVSPAEVQDRIGAVQAAVFTEPAEVRAELQREFGVGDSLGAATAYYLDPATAVPKIQQQLAAARIGGAAVRTGYGLLTPEETTRLAQQGVTAGQAQQGFGALASQSELFAPLPGEVGTGVTRGEQLGAAFEGNAADRQLIERQQRARLAVFGGGGNFGATQKGVAGLGSAATG